MSRFVDAKPFLGSDEEYFGRLTGSSDIARACGFAGPGDVDRVVGRISHLAVLQPQRFEDEVRSMPDIDVLREQYRTNLVEKPKFSGAGSKAAREAWEAEQLDKGLQPVTPSSFAAAERAALRESWELDNRGKTIVTPSQHELAQQMRGGLLSHPLIDHQIRERDDVVFEQSYEALDTVTGLHVRIRPDAWRPAICFDMKTAKSPGFYEFMRSVSSYGYFIQAALYVDVLEALTGQRPRFSWLVVGKLAPHRAGIYGATDDWLDVGRRFYDAGLKIIAAAKRDEVPALPWWSVGGHYLEPPPPYLQDAATLHESHAESVWGQEIE